MDEQDEVIAGFGAGSSSTIQQRPSEIRQRDGGILKEPPGGLDAGEGIVRFGQAAQTSSECMARAQVFHHESLVTLLEPEI
jgi:hypothetical protein